MRPLAALGATVSALALLGACGAKSALLVARDDAGRIADDASADGRAPRGDGGLASCPADAEPPQPTGRLVGRACEDACQRWARPLAPAGSTVVVTCAGGRTFETCLRGDACTAGGPHLCFCGNGPACEPGAVCARDAPDRLPTCRCIAR